MENSKQAEQQKSIENWIIGKGEPKAHHLTSPITVPLTSEQSLTQPNYTQPPKGSQAYPYLLKLSDKDRQMVASNWLLNKDLRTKLEIKQLELKIKDFRSLISKETGLVYWGVSSYFITWLDDLEGTGDYVRLSFRKSKLKGECLNYCVVKSSNK